MVKIGIAGRGGQGIVYLGRLIGSVALEMGLYSAVTSSYGAEVRGGTANCTVSISDEEIASPVASEPEFVVAMNQPSFIKFQNLLQSGGLILVNSSMVNISSVRGDIEVIEVPTSELAEKLGNIKVANMVMLGAFIKVSNLVSFPTMLKNLREILGEGKSKFLKINEKALQLGFNFLKEKG